MFQSLCFVALVAVFSASALARPSAAPSEFGYNELRKYLNERYAVPLGKACFATVVVPSKNCHVEISPAPACEHDWAWDQIQISVEAGDKHLNVFPLAAHTNSSLVNERFTFYQYDRESEEGRKTGPLFLEEVVIFDTNTLTASTQVSHPEWAKTITCKLE